MNQKNNNLDDTYLSIVKEINKRVQEMKKDINMRFEQDGNTCKIKYVDKGADHWMICSDTDEDGIQLFIALSDSEEKRWWRVYPNPDQEYSLNHN